MKITPTDPYTRLRQTLDRAHDLAPSGGLEKMPTPVSDPGSRQAPADGVRLSVRAQELSHLRDALEHDPDLRRELIEKLRDAIRSGHYRVDGVRIANGLMQEEQQLAGNDDPLKHTA